MTTSPDGPTRHAVVPAVGCLPFSTVCAVFLAADKHDDQGPWPSSVAQFQSSHIFDLGLISFNNLFSGTAVGHRAGNYSSPNPSLVPRSLPDVLVNMTRAWPDSFISVPGPQASGVGTLF